MSVPADKRHSRKVCRECKTEKTRSVRHFYRDTRLRDGFMATCKICHDANNVANKALKAAYYKALQRRLDARPEAVARRRAYAQSERGRQVMRAANREYYKFKRISLESRP